MIYKLVDNDYLLGISDLFYIGALIDDAKFIGG